MARRKNKLVDVFRFIDMHDGDRDVCWEWTGSLGGRDLRPYFNVDGSRRLAYRIVYELVKGEDIPVGQVARHTCDNKICCNPYHIVLGTHQDNMDDMKLRERHGLPHHTVRAIRNLLGQKLHDGRPAHTHTAIAERFGVSRQLITEINRGKVYQHVEKEDE